jgi:hypothetical protein
MLFRVQTFFPVHFLSSGFRVLSLFHAWALSYIRLGQQFLVSILWCSMQSFDSVSWSIRWPVTILAWLLSLCWEDKNVTLSIQKPQKLFCSFCPCCLHILQCGLNSFDTSPSTHTVGGEACARLCRVSTHSSSCPLFWQAANLGQGLPHWLLGWSGSHPHYIPDQKVHLHLVHLNM